MSYIHICAFKLTKDISTQKNKRSSVSESHMQERNIIRHSEAQATSDHCPQYEHEQLVALQIEAHGTDCIKDI